MFYTLGTVLFSLLLFGSSVQGWSSKSTDRRGFVETASGVATGLLLNNQAALAFPRNLIYEPAPESLSGQVHVITGATTGLGLESAKRLAAAGATVVLTSRTTAKGERAQKQVQEYLEERGNIDGKVSFLTLDLEHFYSIRSFPSRFKSLMGENATIDVLMNNAGLKVEQLDITEDGFERTYQSNHLGPFLLTALLFPVLDRQGGARVINLSSVAHSFAKMATSSEMGLDMPNLNGEISREAGWTAYAATKLENILFTQELQRRADANGLTWLTTIAVHPGVVGTDIWRDTSVAKTEGFSYKTFVSTVFYNSVLTTEEGANSQIFLASAPSIAKGAYYNEKGRVQNLESFARDPIKAKELWEISEKLTGVDFTVA